MVLSGSFYAEDLERLLILGIGTWSSELDADVLESEEARGLGKCLGDVSPLVVPGHLAPLHSLDVNQGHYLAHQPYCRGLLRVSENLYSGEQHCALMAMSTRS